MKIGVEFRNVNRIVIDPQNENLVLVCANGPSNPPASGIHRSTDGGQTWTKVFSSAGRVQQIITNPLNFNTLYAAVNGTGVLKSTDGGVTWQLSSTGVNAPSRVEIAIAPSDTSRIYAATEAGSDLYVSENGAASWRRVDDLSGTNPNWLGAQGWYDNTIAVHPYDPNLVYVGGINIWQIDLASSDKKKVTSVEQNNTSSFLNLYNFGGSLAGGGIELGTAINARAIGDTDLVTVELRFGPGMSQKAHRFTPSRTLGRALYPYANYIDVPFQVWDVTNDRQLMASFRDYANDGAFNLVAFDPNNIAQEEIFVHLVPYNANSTDANIARRGGELYKALYLIWPMLPDSAVWDPAALPASNIRLNVALVKTLDKRNTTRLTNWFPQQENPNHPTGFYPFVHADQHNITMILLDPAAKTFRILNASDGGVAYSDDGGVLWTTAYSQYITTQFYDADKAPGLDEYIGGTQDNGTWRSNLDGQSNSPWSFDLGGDGFGVSWHYRDADKIIGSLYNDRFSRTLNHGQSWQSAITGLADANTNSPFITTLGKSPRDPDLLFTVGASGVWRSDNFAGDWFLSPIASGSWAYNGLGGQEEISLVNPHIVWAGFRMAPANNSSSNIHVSTDGGFSFRRVNPYALRALANISGMATHPREDSTAFLTFSFAGAPKILRTRDLGKTWEDLSGFEVNNMSNNGFPDVATYAVAVMPHRSEEIWAGTEIGLFISTDEGKTWSYANNGLPAVSIWKMRIVDDQVVLATHGRGIWSVTIPEITTYQPPPITLSPVLEQLAQGPDGSVTAKMLLRSSYDSTQVILNGNRAILVSKNAPVDTVVQIPLVITEPQTVSLTLIAYANGVAYRSVTRTTTVVPLSAARNFYTTNFNTANTDFLGEGFNTGTPAGFANAVLQTGHPYADNLTITQQLTIPIIVAASNAFLNYDDIALVEPGEPGSEFGDEDFYDYVVVEATRNGIEWIPLAPGYDCRYDRVWETAFRNQQPGTPSMFRKHRLNLLDKFQAGETILIRFRLFADPFVNGWGWAVDNLEIQQLLTGVSDRDEIPLTFDLRPNYPNPFNPATQIAYSLAGPVNVKLAVYNSVGQLVRTLVSNQKQIAGVYRVHWNGRNDAGEAVTSGVYLYRLEAGNFVRSRKMLFLQ